MFAHRNDLKIWAAPRRGRRGKNTPPARHCESKNQKASVLNRQVIEDSDQTRDNLLIHAGWFVSAVGTGSLPIAEMPHDPGRKQTQQFPGWIV